MVLGAISLGEGNPTEAFVQFSSHGTNVSAADSEAGLYPIHIPKEKSTPSGVISWKEAVDMGYKLTKEDMVKGL
jgi:hypothetical protein